MGDYPLPARAVTEEPSTINHGDQSSTSGSKQGTNSLQRVQASLLWRLDPCNAQPRTQAQTNLLISSKNASIARFPFGLGPPAGGGDGALCCCG